MTTKNTISLYMKDSEICYEMDAELTKLGMNEKYKAVGLLEYMGIEGGEYFYPKFTFNEDGSATISMGKFTLGLSANEVAGAAQHAKNMAEERHQKHLAWMAEQNATKKQLKVAAAHAKVMKQMEKW